FYIRAFPLSHTKTCVGYTLEELDRPGEFNPEKAESLGIPRGPLWGKLQRGEEVTSADGKIVKPSDVMGEKRSGRKFSFVTDTQYLPSIAREVQGSDLLICEGMFADDCEDQAKEKKHMTARQAATIARDSASSRMAMIHYSPRYTDRELDVLLKQAQEVYPKAELTKDRMIFDIPYID
ncbi:MAG: ribonuclease Z, partial [Treponema sp.]|nr:ribonuclease Z [Treponema sp.]